MIRRLGMLLIAFCLGAVFCYLSRFWNFALWSRPGLLGWEALPPQGGLLARWLRGTDAAPFELLIWAVGCFLVLSFAQMLYDRATAKTKEEGDKG